MTEIKAKKMISKERRSFLSDLAESIALRFFNSNEPILPEVISREYKVGYSYGEYGDYFDGMLEHSAGKFHIFINTAKHNNAQRHRFSFAHELGHYFIDEHSIALAQGLSAGHCSQTGFLSERIVEREADLFAASLLMPESRIISVYRKRREFSFGTIESISRAFQVSILSAMYRIFYLDLHPLMIIKTKNGKLVGKPLRSNDFYFYLKKNTLPDDTGPYHFFNDGSEYKTRELYAFDWFETDSTTTIYERNIYHKTMNTVYSILWMN